MNKLIKHLKKYFCQYGLSAIGVCLTGTSLAVGTDPLAATIKPEITALFGSGSTVSYAIYVGEIILGAVGYIKSKNPMILIGVPVLVLFTHGMFSYIAS